MVIGKVVDLFGSEAVPSIKRELTYVLAYLTHFA
jgi:hypothetical protein